MPPEVYVSAAVEGLVDEAVVQRLIRHVGGVPGAVYGKEGKELLRRKVAGYDNAARNAPWIVLVDLDRDHACAPPLVKDWLPNAAPQLCFRVAVRAVEAWLLADRERLAAFLKIRANSVSQQPETLDDPKRALVDLARSSRRRAIRDEMVPRAGSGRPVGPAYTSRVIEYARNHWRPDVAASRADSLRRAIECLTRLIRSSSGSATGDLFS